MIFGKMYLFHMRHKFSLHPPLILVWSMCWNAQNGFTKWLCLNTWTNGQTKLDSLHSHLCVCSGRRYIYKFYPLCNVLINNVFFFTLQNPHLTWMLEAQGEAQVSTSLMVLSVTCLFYHTHCLRMEPQN